MKVLYVQLPFLTICLHENQISEHMMYIMVKGINKEHMSQNVTMLFSATNIIHQNIQVNKLTVPIYVNKYVCFHVWFLKQGLLPS